MGDTLVTQSVVGLNEASYWNGLVSKQTCKKNWAWETRGQFLLSPISTCPDTHAQSTGLLAVYYTGQIHLHCSFLQTFPPFFSLIFENENLVSFYDLDVYWNLNSAKLGQLSSKKKRRSNKLQKTCNKIR